MNLVRMLSLTATVTPESGSNFVGVQLLMKNIDVHVGVPFRDNSSSLLTLSRVTRKPVGSYNEDSTSYCCISSHCMSESAEFEFTRRQFPNAIGTVSNTSLISKTLSILVRT